MMKRSVPGLSDAEAAAYDAPFPDRAIAQARAGFPELVPVTPEMQGVDDLAAVREVLPRRVGGSTFMAVGMQDPVLGPPVMQALSKTIRGCPPPLEIAEAGHFVQEHGQVVARRALAAFGDS